MSNGNENNKKGKLIILSSPSGGGKTTIMRELVKTFPQLEFSVSATSRAARHTEREGEDFYFISKEEFQNRVKSDEFVEWEEVYSGTLYGTLRSELERIWSKGNVIIFDVDVKGGLNLKKIFGEAALAIFIMPPSVKELHRRLIARDTDSEEFIEQRIAKAKLELEDADKFDKVVVNDKLETAVPQMERLVADFIKE